jgi:hypothetical protein
MAEIMTEMEFFIEYEIRPDPGIPARGVQIWKRDSGYFGEIRIVNHDHCVAEVPTERGIGRAFARRPALVRWRVQAPARSLVRLTGQRSIQTGRRGRYA